jgi:predicted nucleic acid-binding protein
VAPAPRPGPERELSAHEATSVVLTGQLGGELLTADQRLDRAPRAHAHLAMASL